MSLFSIALTQIQPQPAHETDAGDAAAREEASPTAKRINTRTADVRQAEGARNRARLMREILLKPGQRRAALIRASGLSLVAVRHHLQALVTDGKVTATTIGRWAHYYPAKEQP